MKFNRDSYLKDQGWTEREINLLNAYEAKIADFARETARNWVYFSLLKDIKDLLEQVQAGNFDGHTANLIILYKIKEKMGWNYQS